MVSSDMVQFFFSKNRHKVYVYTDGSYSSCYPDRYAGAFLVYRGVNCIHTNSGCGTKAIAMKNIAGELSAVMHAAKWLKDNNYSGVIVYDYIGIGKWMNGGWKAKKGYTKAYKDFMTPYVKAGIVSFKHVKGHNGDLGNSLADNLAREALTSGKEWS